MLIRIVGFFLIIITLCNCQTKSPELAKSSDSTNVFNPATEIKIGAIYSMTGSDAANNLRGLNGTLLAVKEINRQGGILGKKIILQIYDDESLTAGAKECARKAVKDSVVAILGCTYSRVAMAAATIAQSDQVPLVAHIATHTALTSIGEYVFRACYNNRLQSQLLAKFVLTELKIKDAAILFLEGDSYSVDLKEDFIAAFKSGGGKIVSEFGFKKDDTDFAQPLQTIQKLKPALLFIPAYISQSGMICKQAVRMGIKSIFLGADGWDDGIFSYSGTNITNSYFIDHWDLAVENPGSKRFCTAYATEYGNKIAPNSNSALAYDAVYLLKSAITEAGSFNRKAIREKLQNIKFNGITGDIIFDENRNPAKQAVIKKIINDSIVYFKSIKI